VLLIFCQLTEEPELFSSGMPEMHPAPHQSAGDIGCDTDAGGWVGATISWVAGGISGRTVVKNGDRGVGYVYIAAAQPVCRIMGAPRG